MTSKTDSQMRAEVVSVRWPYDQIPPGNENLKLVFDGLMAFCYNSEGCCEIGLNPGRGKHSLALDIFTNVVGNPPCKRFPAFTAAQVMRASKITVEILDSAPSVNFYHLNDFDRINGDPRDFAWMLDMEKDFHPAGVQFGSNPFPKKVFVKQGKFYTSQLTQSTFNRIDDPNNPGTGSPTSLGHMPRLTAAAINIPVGAYALLTLDNLPPLPLPGIPFVNYEIQFTNECFDSGSRCQWLYPRDANEERRNDFCLHYDAFRPRSGHVKYGIILDNGSGATPSLNKCSEGGLRIDNTDEAPCMATGYGQTGGFPQ